MIPLSFSPAAKGIECTRHCEEQLKDFSSEELKGLVLILTQQNKHSKVDKFYLTNASLEDDLFICAGACDILKERHGEEYLLNIFGLTKPKTIGEKLIYLFTGTRPKYIQS
jgi:hypothetical protein